MAKLKYKTPSKTQKAVTDQHEPQVKKIRKGKKVIPVILTDKERDHARFIHQEFEKYDPDFLVVDIFCGKGGTTLGFENAEVDGRKIALVIACINHDHLAIQSHWVNHSYVEHFNEDVTKLFGHVLQVSPGQSILFMSPEMRRLIRLVDIYRACYPTAKLIVWGSPDCTNFSNAKGGESREQDSRTLAEYLDRYFIPLDPDFIDIENVREFMAWGPLVTKIIKTKGPDGKSYESTSIKYDKKLKKFKPVKVPESRTKGRDFIKWCKHIESLGYNSSWILQNAANYGAYTSRIRLFGQFCKKGLPIAWAEPTHAKKPKDGVLGKKHKWKAVREVLDLEDVGISIFNRFPQLVEATLKRIYAGLVKFVANGKEPFLSKYNSGNVEARNLSINGPAGTILTSNSHSLVTSIYISDIQYFMMKYHGTGENIFSANDPCSTIPTKDSVGIVFLDQQYGNSTPQGIDQPASVITKNPKLAAAFIQRAFGEGGGKLVDIEGPIGALLSVPKTDLVTCEQFIMPTNFTNNCSSLNNPCPVITSDRHHHYLLNPQYNSAGSSVEDPCFTLIAGMPKSPPYLMTAETGEVFIVIYPDDSETMKKIKLFMVEHKIIDIKMRMLKESELLPIMGFPVDSRCIGTQTDVKKQIGNAVHPLIPQYNSIARALTLRNHLKNAA